MQTREFQKEYLCVRRIIDDLGIERGKRNILSHSRIFFRNYGRCRRRQGSGYRSSTGLWELSQKGRTLCPTQNLRKILPIMRVSLENIQIKPQHGILHQKATKDLSYQRWHEEGSTAEMHLRHRVYHFRDRAQNLQLHLKQYGDVSKKILIILNKPSKRKEIIIFTKKYIIIITISNFHSPGRNSADEYRDQNKKLVSEQKKIK